MTLKSTGRIGEETTQMLHHRAMLVRLQGVTEKRMEALLSRRDSGPGPAQGRPSAAEMVVRRRRRRLLEDLMALWSIAEAQLRASDGWARSLLLGGGDCRRGPERPVAETVCAAGACAHRPAATSAGVGGETESQNTPPEPIGSGAVRRIR